MLNKKLLFCFLDRAMSEAKSDNGNDDVRSDDEGKINFPMKSD